MFIIFLLTILLLLDFGQMDLGIRPDVTFGGQNDRFDIGNIMEEQNEPEEEDYRRHMEDQAERLEDAGTLQESATNTIANELENSFLDKPEQQETEFGVSQASDGKSVDDNFKKSFKVFKINAKQLEEEYKRRDKEFRRSAKIMKYLHGDEPSRRVIKKFNTDAEVLMHYAVPVVLRIQGYVQAPLVE